jgi:general secretion pathway protein A
MYPAFFGLTELPFAITPDPRYLYLSTRHADALAHLLYGINEAGGFIQLTGEVGTGKTTTIRTLLVRAPENAVIALLLNPHLTPTEFLRSLNQELGLEVAPGADGHTKELIDSLNRYLLRAHAEGRRVVLIIDEAQNLAPEVLEQVRLLTNLETASHKLLQIILIGQPELRTLLGRTDLRQLAQRVTARYHLQPLSRAETADYVRHRLRVAGATSEPFSAGALREVYRLSRGVPRVVNVICDRAMLGAYTQDRRVVSAALVRRAAAEVFGRRVWPRYSTEVAAALPLLLFAGLLWVYHVHWPVWPARSAAAVVPVKPVPPPPPPPPSLTELLHQHGAELTPDAAFAGLLQLWNVPYTPGGAAACTQASEHGLECETMHGSLAELRELNRPAVLTLSDATGASYSALVLGVGATAVSLRLGDQQADVSIAELSRFWFGDFVLLWHPSIRPVTDLAVGMQGPAVQQLRAQLTRWNGNPADEAPAGSGAKYDRALVQLVEQFQRAHHLAVDGIAGLDTQMLLDSSLPAPATPLLQPVADSRG